MKPKRENESQVIICNPKDLSQLKQLAQRHGVTLTPLSHEAIENCFDPKARIPSNQKYLMATYEPRQASHFRRAVTNKGIRLASDLLISGI